MKRKLLIMWSNPYLFIEQILPVIPKLAHDFSISVILVDSFSPPAVTSALKGISEGKLIDKYWIIPGESDLIKHHLFISKKLPEWKDERYETFLSISGMQVFERYLLECALPPTCVKACFWPTITYLLKDETTARRLLKMPVQAYDAAYSGGEQTRKASLLQKLLKKVKSSRSFNEVAGSVLLSGWEYLKHPVNVNLGRFRAWVDRVLLPLILVGRTFPLMKDGAMTQIASELVHNYIFSDDLDAKAFAALVSNANVMVSKYPTHGSCRCGAEEKNKQTLLMPLTTNCASDRLPDGVLADILRDIRLVFAETGAKKVHLRLHPRERLRWPRHLEEYLVNNGIAAECVESEKPIREIICDYSGIVGFPSNALRDGRAACDNTLVIGFAALSRHLSSNPKLWFGNSEGIGWINNDGTYDRDIFRKRKFVPPIRKGIEEIMVDLVSGSRLK